MPLVRKVASLRRLFHFLLPPDSRLTSTAAHRGGAAVAASQRAAYMTRRRRRRSTKGSALHWHGVVGTVQRAEALLVACTLPYCLLPKDSLLKF